jgi:L-arabinokinase
MDHSELNIAFYITGHGLGHATRAVKVIVELLTWLPNMNNLHIITSAKTSFFEQNIPNEFFIGKIIIHNRILDAGAVQTDAIRVNPRVTLDNMWNMHTRRDKLLQDEVKFLEDSNVSLVITDVTAMALKAASMTTRGSANINTSDSSTPNGIPCCILSNFTWSYIYTKMLEECIQHAHKNCPYGKCVCRDTEFPSISPASSLSMSISEGLCISCHELYKKYSTMCETITNDYECTTKFLQYPGMTPPPANILKEDIITLPMLTRIANISRTEQRKRLGIKDTTKVLVLGFGGMSGGWKRALDGKTDALPEGWVCLVLGAKEDDVREINTLMQSNKKEGEEEANRRQFIPIPFDAYIPNFVNAADVMFGKIGYGTVSEALAHHCPLMFIPRISWPEQSMWYDAVLI